MIITMNENLTCEKCGAELKVGTGYGEEEIQAHTCCPNRGLKACNMKGCPYHDKPEFEQFHHEPKRRGRKPLPYCPTCKKPRDDAPSFIVSELANARAKVLHDFKLRLYSVPADQRTIRFIEEVISSLKP
jgi:hypothetical protein